MSDPNYPYTYPHTYPYAPSSGEDAVPAGYTANYSSYGSTAPLPSGQTWPSQGAAGRYPQYPAGTAQPFYSQYPAQSAQYPQTGAADYYSGSYQTTSQYPATSGYGVANSALPTTESGLNVPLSSLSRSRSGSRAKSPGSNGRTWTCDIPDCPSTAQFTRLADLQRHQATVHHNDANKPFSCTVSRCSRVGPRGFTRRDHLTEHLRSYHHLDIRKRRPGERSAAPQ